MGEFDKAEFIKDTFRCSAPWVAASCLPVVGGWPVVQMMAALFSVKCLAFVNHTLTHYTRIDIEEFHDGVMAYLFGSRSLRPEIEARKPLAALLLAASIALCGCDFVQVLGMRADRVLPIVRDIARNRPDLLALMAGVQTGDALPTAGAADAIRVVVEDYVSSIKGAPRLKKAVAHASACSQLQLLRACWTTAYWSTREFKNVYDWGFCHAAME